jgi:hypothetical protein
MDLIALGDQPKVLSLEKGTSNGYSNFCCTSAAAPHVAGTVALFASYLLR